MAAADFRLRFGCADRELLNFSAARGHGCPQIAPGCHFFSVSLSDVYYRITLYL